MTRIEYLENLLPIIYPNFYVAKDEDSNELVFWDFGEHHILNKAKIADKTQCEAFVNHIHLFNKVGFKNKNSVIKIGVNIAKNLLKSLISIFPDKKFVVFLEVNVNDSTIIRFHQIWENEPLYIDIKGFKDKNVKIFEFKN